MIKGIVALVMHEGPNFNTVFLISPGAPVIPYLLICLPKSCLLYPPTKNLYARLRPIGKMMNASSRARHIR